MVGATDRGGIVEIFEQRGAVSGEEVNAGDLALLQVLVWIERAAEILGAASDVGMAPQLGRG